jgi:hypothetical protein
MGVDLAGTRLKAQLNLVEFRHIPKKPKVTVVHPTSTTVHDPKELRSGTLWGLPRRWAIGGTGFRPLRSETSGLIYAGSEGVAGDSERMLQVFST